MLSRLRKRRLAEASSAATAQHKRSAAFKEAVENFKKELAVFNLVWNSDKESESKKEAVVDSYLKACEAVTKQFKIWVKAAQPREN